MGKLGVFRRTLIICTVLALGWAGQAFGVATNWVDSKRMGGRAYFLHNSSPRIEIYDLATETWQTAITLHQIPTAFHVDNEYLYIAYSQAVYRYAHNGTGETHLGNFTSSVRELLTDGNLLFVFYSSAIKVLNRTTAAVVGDSTGMWSMYYMSTGFSILPQTRAVYGCSTGISPADIGKMTYSSTGQIQQIIDSPHHGDYTIGNQTWVFPGNDRVVDSSGNVYDAVTLQHQTSFGVTIKDLAFHTTGKPIVLSGTRIIAYSPTLLDTGFKDLAVTPQTIYVRSGDVAAFYPDDLAINGISVEFVPLSALKPAEPGPAVDPTELAFTPDDAFITTANILFMFSKSKASLFRWDLAEHAWIETIPLLGGPDYVTYSSANNAVYTVYSDGKIKVIDLGAIEPREVPFANLPTGPFGMVAAGEFLVTGDGSGAWAAHSTWGPDGTMIDYKDWNYPLAGGVWCEAERAIFHFRDSMSPNDLIREDIGTDGAIMGQYDSPYHGDVFTRYPIRVKPDGTYVILGSGQMYAPVSLEQINTLSETMDDATWLGNDLYTIGTSGVTHWRLPTFAKDITWTIPGTGFRLMSVLDNVLVLVYIDGEGIPRVALMTGDYTAISNLTFYIPPVLHIEGMTAHSVSLNWTDLNGEVGYVIQRKVGPAGNWIQVGVRDADETVFTDPSVVLGGVYFYRVYGTDGTDYSAFSNPVEAALIQPPVPAGLAGMVVDQTDVLLTWDDGPYETGYKIERSQLGLWATVTTVPADTTTYLDDDLAEGTTYRYRITALHPLFPSGPSEEVVMETLGEHDASGCVATRDRGSLGWGWGLAGLALLSVARLRRARG